MIPHDLLADLPAPHDDEPPSLRSDILDELADHLHCAFRREVLKDGDETAAEQRVLDRFGDPKNLARRLWWQAMWSRIMGKRILSGLQWLLTLAAVIMAGAVFWQQSAILSEMNSARQEESGRHQYLSQVLIGLGNRLPTPVGSAGTADAVMGLSAGGGGVGGSMVADSDTPTWRPLGDFGGAAGFSVGMSPAGAKPPTLIVKLVQDTVDGPPVKEIKEIVLEGANSNRVPGVPERPPGMAPSMGGGGAGSAGLGSIAATVSDTGRYFFSALEPGRYLLRIRLADEQKGQQLILIRNDKPRELTVICPGPRKKAAVLITAPPLPDDLRNHGLRLRCLIDELPLQIGQIGWKVPGAHHQRAHFDLRSGQVSQIGSANFMPVEFSQTGEQDRSMFFHVGPLSIRFFLGGVMDNRGVQLQWPLVDDPPVMRMLEPGENRWELKLPEELLAAARKQMAGVLAPRESRGGDEDDVRQPPGDSPGAKTAPEDDSDGDVPNAAADTGRITIIAKRETTAGEPVPNMQIPVWPLNGPKRLDLLLTTQTDAEGRAVLSNLEPGRYEIHVGAQDGGCQGSVELRIRAGDDLQRQILVPVVNKVPVKLTSALPDDLAQAGVRVCLILRPEPLSLNGVNLHIYQPDGSNWRIPYVLGPDGVGMLRTRTDPRPNLDRPKFPGKVHLADGNDGKALLPAVRLSVAKLSLIGPAKDTEKTKNEDSTHETEPVWEYFAQAKESSLKSEFLPDVERDNEWHIQIPDDVLMAAWKKLKERKTE